MMAAELKWCYDLVYLIYEIAERRAVTRQKGDKLLHRAEGYKSGNSCKYGYRCLFSTGWWRKETQREVEKRRYSRSSCFFRRGHTRKFTGCTWYKIEFGKEEGNLEALSKKVNFMTEILARPVLRTTTRGASRQADCTSNIAWNLARKYASSKPRTITFCSLVKASETQKIVCLFWIRELQCLARKIELRYTGYFEEVQFTP